MTALLLAIALATAASLVYLTVVLYDIAMQWADGWSGE